MENKNVINYEWYLKKSKEQVYEKKDYEIYKKFYDDLSNFNSKKRPS